jgi:hypothetical protein
MAARSVPERLAGKSSTMESMRRTLTRRDALAGAAAAGAGMLLGPSLARAAPPGGVLSHPVGELAPGAVRTISLGRPAALVAVGWTAPKRTRIELRARRADGRWGPWGLASTCAGHEGDGVDAGTPIGEGTWVGACSELQLRSDGAVHGVELVCVAAEAGTVADALAKPGRLPYVATALPAGPGQPPIIARQAWAEAGHPPHGGPFYGGIELGFVHHTENPNGYSAAEVPAMLRAIYAFHVHGRGWFDIGYNFVVDDFGRIWEARAGGVDAPVIGAQAGDWNSISFGVAVLGTFDGVLPSRAALRALERLLAWKMSLSGLPVLGRIAAVVARDDVRDTQFHTGEHIHLPRIAGHRDGDATDCPGELFYRHLPVMRPRIARLAGTPALLTLDAELDELVTGPLLALSGRLARRAGAPIAGAPVTLQALGGLDAPVRLATTTTGPDGRFSATVVPQESMLLRAVHAQRPAAVSALLAIERVGGPTGAAAHLRISR